MKLLMPGTGICQQVRKYIKPVLFFSIAILLSCSATAQKAWTLQECIEYALKNNIQIKQSELTAELSTVNFYQSKAAFFPSINANSNYTYNFGRSVNPYTNVYTNQEVQSMNISASGSLPIFNGFQIMNSLSQSKYEYMASHENLAKIKNDISLNVAAAYLQVLYSKEALKAVDDRLNAATQNRDRTKIMVDAGSMAQGNFLDAEAALAAEELAKVNADNQLITAIITITQLLELKSTEDFDVAQPAVDIRDLSSLSISADEIYNTALKTLPDFRASALNIQSAEKGLAISRGARYPRLSLGGGLSTGYSNVATRFLTNEEISFNDQLNENYNKYLGLSLSIPIFNGWATESSVKRAKINLENVKYNDQLIRNQAYKSIVQAHADAIAAQQKYTASQKAASSSNEAFVYAEKKYNVGMLSSIEFLNVRNTSSRAESDLIQAKYDFIFRLKVIDFYLGKSLAF
ncbi:MAG: TolC family protein [Bacteroidota bacterium]|nr:TolC family protein [Bacteroidota bacterium]